MASFERISAMQSDEVKKREHVKILLLGSDQETLSSLSDKLSQEDFKIEITTSILETGLLAAEIIRPDCVVIDFLMGAEKALSIVKTLQGNFEYNHMILIGLLEDAPSDSDEAAFDHTFLKPFDLFFLAQRIKVLLPY